LAGCGALKKLDADHAEIKSMRNCLGAPAKALLHASFNTHRGSERRGYRRLSLETDPWNLRTSPRLTPSSDSKIAAICGMLRPNSVFMTGIALAIIPAGATLPISNSSLPPTNP